MKEIEEQYCAGTWNVKHVNQGKLEMVQQEMERVNIDILGISELKWTAVGEFISTTVGKKKWSSPNSQQESEMQYLDAISKMTE